jgi:gliding motility-associated lipoprotein GldH
MKLREKVVFLFLFSSLFFSSCDMGQQTVYEEYHKMENIVWEKFDNQVFEINDLEENQAYDVYLEIRHLPEYPFDYFFFTLAVIQPDGNYRAQEYKPYLKKAGVWESDCMGDFCDFSFPVKKHFYINQKGSYKFEFENRMPKNPLIGVIEVGLVIKKSPVEEKEK